MPSNESDKRKLQISIGICLFAGAVGSLFTFAGMMWYRNLRQPAIAPPSWVFAPVWILLYVLMGCALYNVRKRQPQAAEEKKAQAWFFIQLFLNVLWPFCFFYSREPGMAFFEIIFLWLAIGGTVWAFRKVSLVGAALLLPYWAWVTFACYLNIAFWKLNF